MGSDKLNIMILAAGLGERLRPITEHIPKPLVPIMGRPVLQYVLDALSGIHYDRIGINLHHKKEMMERWISHCSLKERIVTFPESSVLGTGGALKNAESFLCKETFLVHNADIISDIDLSMLIRQHFSSQNLVTLAVHDFPRFNNVVIDEKGLLRGIGSHNTEGKRRAFTGIAVYDPAFLEFLPHGKSSVVDGWMKAAGSGRIIGTCDVTGSYWTDTGTPASYAAAVFTKLRNEGEVLYIHPSVTDCSEWDIKGYVVVEEGAAFDRPVTLRNCAVLPDVMGEKFAERGRGIYENCIIGPGFTIALSEQDIICMEEGRQLIGTGGSDRRYFRVRENYTTSVLMECLHDDSDFDRHIRYTSFFHDHGVPVPELKEHDAEKKRAVFEDAGDLSLYSWLKCPRDREAIERLYKKVVDGLVRIHRIGTDSASGDSLLQERKFDHSYFRWETDYFIQRFVKGLMNLDIENTAAIDRELDDLAELAASFPQTVVHRDFQSQNIMVVPGEDIRIIDFQGARMGPPAYDLASLLWDPYYRLTDGLRNDLMNYYADGMIGEEGILDQDVFIGSLLSCRLQRHMQALGAYGFLSVEKGKKYFLKFVPEGLRLLKGDLAEAGNGYPALRNLVEELFGEAAKKFVRGQG